MHEFFPPSHEERLLARMEAAQEVGQLSLFIRNIQIASATFLKDYSLTDSEFKLAFKMKQKLKNGIRPSDEEKLLLALKIESLFVEKNSL